MRSFTSIGDLDTIPNAIKEAIALKQEPNTHPFLGKHKTLAMLFFNASLRTRLSTEKAAKNLGMEVMILNIGDAWNLEFEDGSVMNTSTSEHIKCYDVLQKCKT